MNDTKKYFAELVFNSDGTINVKRAKRLTGLNQHKRSWIRVNSRNLARSIKKGNLVTK